MQISTTEEIQTESMMQSMLKLSMFLIIGAIVSCAHDSDKQEALRSESTTYDNPVSELTQEQQSAFDALDTLQTSTDEMNRLYSTLVNKDGFNTD